MTMTATYPAGGRRFAITILPAEPEPSAGDEANHRIANSLQLLSAMKRARSTILPAWRRWT